MKLFTVGPVACRPEVLAEMGRQMYSHRSEDYKVLHRETIAHLQRFLETEKQVFLFPSSGSGVMEASVRNCVEKKMLCCINGEFGKRYADVGDSNGKEVVRMEIELGKPVTPELLDEKLSSVPDVEAVTITYNETSVGIMNPLPELAKVVKERGKLLFVDAVSAMGGAEIKVDKWGLDVCFTSSQKCFGIPPGLAMASVSDEAMKRSETAKNKGWYFDFKLYEKHQQKDSGTHMTPPIPQIAGLRKELEIIEREGGKQKRLDLYKKRMGMIKEGVEKLGLSLFPQPGYESPTVACVCAPQGMSGPDVYKQVRQRGIELAQGYGALKEKTFRIGNMGYIRIEDFEEMMSTLGDVVQKSDLKQP